MSIHLRESRIFTEREREIVCTTITTNRNLFKVDEFYLNNQKSKRNNKINKEENRFKIGMINRKREKRKIMFETSLIPVGSRIASHRPKSSGFL